MVLPELVGITAVHIKQCCFMAVLTWKCKVDWKTADVKTHKHLVPRKLVCSPVLWLPVPCHESEYFTAV